MRKLNLLVLIIAVVFIANNGFSAGTETFKASVKLANIEFPLQFFKKLKGTIGNIPVTMDLEKNEKSLSGTYYYNRIGLLLYLYGTLNSDGSFEIKEMNEKGENTGRFDGAFTDTDNISGTWTNILNSKSLPFKLTVFTENIADILYQDYYREGCNIAKRNEEQLNSDSEITDTICSTISLKNISISGIDGEVASRINNRMLEPILSSEGGAYKNIEEMLASVTNVSAEASFTREIYVSVMTNEPDLLCIQISQSSYYFGAAHPIGYSEFLNFNLNNGQTISLDDVLIDGYQSELNELGKIKFVKEYGSEGWFFEDGSAFEMTKDVAILPGGLLFLWDQYEIGPYMYGTPELFFSWKELSTLIKPESIAAEMQRRRGL